MANFREIITNALHYWERKRVIYNLLLALPVAAHAINSIMSGQKIEWLEKITVLFVLAVIANVLYCAAYLVDIPVQYSEYRRHWLRWRLALFVIGALFALYWANLITGASLFTAPFH